MHKMQVHVLYGKLSMSFLSGGLQNLVIGKLVDETCIMKTKNIILIKIQINRQSDILYRAYNDNLDVREKVKNRNVCTEK